MKQEAKTMLQDWVQEEEIDLSEYLGVLLDAKWLILAFTLVVTMLAGAYAFLATPIYQADALLQVEEKKSPLGTDDLMSLMGQGGASASTEIEIIRSRSVIGKVIKELHLDVSAKPKLAPFIGGYFYRSFAGDGFREPWLGLGEYAWGGQQIQLETFEVPDDLLGKPLNLVAKGSGSFQLYDGDVMLLEGKSGELVEDKAHHIRLYVSKLTAQKGNRFTLVKLRLADVIASARSSFQVSEKGKSTGIISLSFSNPSPNLAKAFVDTVARAYLRQNVERKSEEAKRSLAFLQQQLPQVRGQLEAAETRMNEYRLKSGSVNLSLETQGILDKMVTYEQQLSELEMKRTDLSQRFTDNHPLMQALHEKQQRLLHDKQALEKKVKQLPKTEQKMLTLMRNVKVNTELYTFMLNKSQELKVVEAGTVGDVRILDFAMLPYKPIKPKKSLIVALGMVIGLFLAIVLVFIRKAMHQGLEDSDMIEQKTGLSAFAGIPHSELQAKLHKKMRQSKGKSGEALLAAVDHEDLAIESLRSLRTNLHFALLEAKNNIVMLTGPAPGLGKSFVSANFGAVLAASGQKVLLIDGDMRKGHLHEYFNMQRSPGLSGLVSGDVQLDDAIHPTAIENLCVMPTGVVPPNPADLLMHEKFDAILATLSKRFDLILIDTPPVLAVTDAVLVGRRAGVSFMLLRSGKHPMREIQQAIKHVEHAGIDLAGFIFNDIHPKRSAYGYGNYHYQYSYKKDS